MDDAEKIARLALAPQELEPGGRFYTRAKWTVERLTDAIRGYGEQCRRAGAEAMREAVKHEVAEWVADADDRARLYKAIRALPSAAEAASPAAGTVSDAMVLAFINSLNARDPEFVTGAEFATKFTFNAVRDGLAAVLAPSPPTTERGGG